MLPQTRTRQSTASRTRLWPETPLTQQEAEAIREEEEKEGLDYTSVPGGGEGDPQARHNIQNIILFPSFSRSSLLSLPRAEGGG